MRLDKFLVNSGLGSRKEVKKLIKEKRISINGSFNCKDSDQIDENSDEIFFDGSKIQYSKYIYILLNKPKGYLSATEDKSQPTVLDLVNEYNYLDLFPVGRLDKDTTGCLLITNDGPLAHKLLSPKYHVDKIYEVTIDKEMNNFEIVKKAFNEGIPMDDDTTLPADLESIDSTHFLITLRQGKFHQVKRMFKFFNYTVVELNRKSFSFLTVDGINQGDFRLLWKEEIKQLSKI